MARLVGDADGADLATEALAIQACDRKRAIESLDRA